MGGDRKEFVMRPFDPTRFIALGEGIAAGFAGFAWDSCAQSRSFAAKVAKQLGVEFLQPLMEASGPTRVPGFDKLPVILPSSSQGTVVPALPPESRHNHNLSFPGL